MILERSDSPDIQGDYPPRAPGLGLANPKYRLVSDRDQGVHDRDASFFEIHVSPTDAEHFGSAHPGKANEAPCNAKAVVSDMGEETGELVSGPGFRLRRFHLRQLDIVGR